MSVRFRVLGASTAAVAAFLVGLSLSADVIVPSSAFSKGKNGAEFHSDVRVFNPTTSPINFTPIFYRSDANGNVVNTVQKPVVTIGPRQQISYDNVLQSLFGQPVGVFGPIRFESSGTLLVSSGVNNVNGCGNGSRSGQGLPGIDVGQALKAGTLVQLAASADGATGYRSNLDFTNPGATDAHVTVTIRRGDGTHLSNGTLSVGPNGLVQKAIDDSGAFPGVAGTTDTNLWVEFTSDQPILAFASVIDNGSGDPFAVVMTAEPSSSVAVAAPVASYTVSANAVAGQPVTFTDTSTNSPISRFWVFGDGTVSNSSTAEEAARAGTRDFALAAGVSIQHTYTTAGTYHVTLFVVNALGSSTFSTDIVVAASSTTSSGSTLSFKVDGVAVTGITVTEVLFLNVSGTSILSIAGSSLSPLALFGFGLPAGTGTYTVGPSSPANALLLTGTPLKSWNAGAGSTGSGTITVNTLTSTRAAGTFSFNLAPVTTSGATGTKAITDGVFDVAYTKTP